jgi:CheY-like chemotaxis protein
VIHLIKTSPVTEKKHLRICTTYDTTLPEFIKTDSRRIQQVLFNLLGNAIKFSKENSDVELAIKIQNDAVIFTVKDSGKGIDEKDYAKIFEPFRQTGTGLTNAEGGTGLGLSITKKLVAALGGNIYVESEVDDWTQFTVSLPFTNRPIESAELSSRLKTTTIFLVGQEDCESVKRIEEIFKTFNVDYSFFPASRDVARLVATEGALSLDGHYICMIDENLYDKETYDMFHEKCRSCLISFGPDFTVEKTRKHFRSIVEIFPSVLVSNLGDFTQELSISANGHDMKALKAKKPSPLSTLKIMIAEDNLVNQKVLTRILNRLQVQSISVVGDGEEAVKREASECFDLVLMDMQMPKMDGLEACQLINARQGGHQKPKIVFVTAHVSDTFRQTCIDNGAAGYLPKPCTVDGVKEVLNHAMGQGSMFSPVYTQSWNSDTGIIAA